MYPIFKRLLDLAVALCALVLLGPLMLALALWVKLSSEGPVLYQGTRVGRYGRLFKMLKFRTMVTNADKIGGPSTAGDDPRITRAGRFLRRFKLDELPQFINVLKGDMSLVGPRPEVKKYVDQYTEAEQPILTVRPGITDWASIWNSDEGAVLAGHADPDRAYEELIRPGKLQLQLKYVHECSLITDIRIFCFTIWKLFNKRGLPKELEPYGRLL